MVKIMENLIQMDDLGGKPTIFGNIHMDSKNDFHNIGEFWKSEDRTQKYHFKLSNPIGSIHGTNGMKKPYSFGP